MNPRSNLISREKAVQFILGSRGRMFSVGWKTKSGKDRHLNGKFIRMSDSRRNQDKIFGLITVCESRSKNFKRVDSRTINSLSIDHQRFMVR